jgi:hypothetical protein
VALKENLLAMKDTARSSGSSLGPDGPTLMAFINPIFLSVEDIHDISRYNHYIPFIRQYHHAFIKERFPGWSWDNFLPRLQGAKIVITHEDCSDCRRLAMGLCIDANIEGVWVKLNSSGVRLKPVLRVQ